MAFVDVVFQKNFIEYASYVIKERAIPHLEDGLKPVQRRILHSLIDMDDGKFHKVANVVGHCMKYHPHGDASINSALVVLANKELFIDKQGNYGNIFTGDSAAAARYIECRLRPLAKEVLFNPELTRYEDSYDGRNKEPVTFPSKIPVLLVHGAEGIAVGMATKILPHNLIETLQAQIACLQKKDVTLYPDFLTGGQIDVSDYDDGNGKVLVRAIFDTSDPKKIIIRDIPFGSTTESLISSIESAAKRNKIKISSINDYTAEKVEIEIKLARGVYAENTIEALYAFTECEVSIQGNLLVMKDKKPQILSVTDVISYSADRLIEILKAELENEKRHLLDSLHAKNLEQIFIEKRVYKVIEELDSPGKIIQEVLLGLSRYADQIKREPVKEDIDTLLKIPIRRISLYDINKAKKEIKELKKRVKEITSLLSDLVGYAIGFLERLIEKYNSSYPRQTTITSFRQTDVRKAAKRDLQLQYDKKTGYLGTTVKGNNLLDVSMYDRILFIRKNGDYEVIDVPEKIFVGKGMRFCGFVKKERIYTLLYRDDKTGFSFIKRFAVEKFILNKKYSCVPENTTIQGMTLVPSGEINFTYKPKPRMRTLQERFSLTEYPVRGVTAKGIRLTKKEVKSWNIIEMPGIFKTGNE